MSNETLTNYVGGLFASEDPLLARMRQEAADLRIPGIQVRPELGRLLQLLILQSQATRVLEIGTLFGYSAILMARALPLHGRLITLEVDEKHAAIARRNIERAGVTEKVNLREGDALSLLASIGENSFDLVFIDADKRSYPEYLRWALKLTRPGSIIVADNLWRGGSVASPESEDSASQGIAAFNREIARHPKLFSVMLPRLDCSDAFSLSIVRD